MRVIHLLFIGLFLASSPALAQADSSLYRVEGVMADVTAPSAAQARDDAIIQAQHQALAELTLRLGANGAGEGLSDELLGALVQAFEVQKEHASPGRYTGTFTVQFRPSAIRSFLDQKGMNYTEMQSDPVVVLPVLRAAGRDVLWEESTTWREAWEAASKISSLVPIVVPLGDLSDIATISTQEAINGDPARLKEIIRKYQTSGAIVVVLTAKMDEKGSLIGGQIEGFRYDLEGQALPPLTLALSQTENVNELVTAEVLTQGAKKIIDDMATNWKEKVREKNIGGPTSIMPLDVAVSTLAEWAHIKEKLGQVSSILRVNVATMTRGLVHVELAFHGDIPSLQKELQEQELQLSETYPGRWELSVISN